MSNPRAKAERSAAKDIRQGITEQRPVSVNSKKRLRYKLVGDIEFEYSAMFNRKDYCIGKYEKLSDAEKALKANQKKSYYKNLRIEEL
jgi:hypothetical protein